MKRVDTLVMPISGGKIINQVAACILLARCGYSPDIILGSSGGCITGALLIDAGIADIKCKKSLKAFEEKLKCSVKKLCTENYCRPWVDCAPLNTIMGIGMRSLFDHGEGAAFTDPRCIDFKKQPELWIGTTNKATRESQLFCTKSKAHSHLKFDDAIYLNGNVDEIVDATIASSAVPTIVPPKKIRGKMYEDGGMSFASPLAPFIDTHQEHNITYHVVYVSPARYNKKDDPKEEELEDSDIWNRLHSGTGGMLTGWHVPDRNNGMRVVIAAATRNGDKKDVYKQKGRGIQALKECLEVQDRASVSFIEIAPLEPNMVRFLFMKEGDAYEGVCKALENDFSVRHWYIV